MGGWCAFRLRVQAITIIGVVARSRVRSKSITIIITIGRRKSVPRTRGMVGKQVIGCVGGIGGDWRT